MTAKTAKTATEAEATESTETHAPGTLVHLTDEDRYAILVGYTDAGHALVFDLPNAPREHQTGIEKV